MLRIVVALVFALAIGWVVSTQFASSQSALFHLGTFGITGVMLVFVVAFYIAFKVK